METDAAFAPELEDERVAVVYGGTEHKTDCARNEAVGYLNVVGEYTTVVGAQDTVLVGAMETHGGETYATKITPSSTVGIRRDNVEGRFMT